MAERQLVGDVIPINPNEIHLYFEGEWLYIEIDELEVTIHKEWAEKMAHTILEWPSETPA